MNYYVRRTAQALVTFIAATMIAFALYRLLPGGPVEAIKAQLIEQVLEEGGGSSQINMKQINQRVELYTGIDPDKPLWLAYYEYFTDILFRGDFGTSIRYSKPVFDILFRAMPWSIFVSVYGLLLGFSMTVVLGSLMAYKEGSLFDKGSTVLVLVMKSVPYYVGAIVFLAVFAFQWGLFPTGGRFDPSATPGFNYEFVASVLHHGALPILTGFIVGFGGGALGLRANAVRIIGSDYLHAARLRGISTARITTRYVARNSILPIYMGLMMGIAGIFGSSVIMEYIFQYPGVGWYTFQALIFRDYPLLMGAFLFFTGLTIVGILLADFTYGFIDPRAGTGAEREAF